jgi:AI-2 transport protein TqsA
MVIITIVVCGVALHLLRPVVVPFLLALCFMYCLMPLLDWFRQRLRLPWWLAFTATVLVALLALGGLGFFLVASVISITENVREYHEQLAQLGKQLTESVPLDRLGIPTEAATGQYSLMSQETQKQLLLGVATETTGLVSFGSLVAIFMLFLFLGSRSRLRPTEGLFRDIEYRVRRYLLELFFLSATTGLLVGITLGLCGVRFAAVFGFLAFLLNFIPTIGAVIATLLPLPVILLSPDLSPVVKALAVVLPAAIQGIIGAVFQPRIQGASLDVHPIVIVLSLLFFGMIWGVIGAFLAAPLVGVLKIIFDRIPITQPIGAALAGDLDRFAGLGTDNKPSTNE